MLLKLVNRRPYEDVKRHGVSLIDAITAVNEELDEFGMTSFDIDDAQERSQAIEARKSLDLQQIE